MVAAAAAVVLVEPLPFVAVLVVAAAAAAVVFVVFPVVVWPEERKLCSFHWLHFLFQRYHKSNCSVCESMGPGYNK